MRANSALLPLVQAASKLVEEARELIMLYHPAPAQAYERIAHTLTGAIDDLDEAIEQLETI